MNHEQVLNMILADTCPQSEDHEGFRVFVYDLCCKKAVVVARLVSNNPIKYEVKSCRIVNPWDSVWDCQEVKELIGS